MKIKNRDLFALLDALTLLNTLKISPEDSGATRFNLAKNLRLAREHIEDLQQTRNAMIRDLAVEVIRAGDGKEIVNTTTPAGRQLATQWETLMNKEEEVALLAVDFTKLKVDENNLPFEMLAGLLPILKQTPETNP